MVADWADEYRWLPEEDGSVLPGTERLVQVGGDGTPGVAEFCSLELAAGLGVSEESARLLLRDALAIRGRFPLLWDAVQGLDLRVWQARTIAAHTITLTLPQCLELDEELAAVVSTMSWKRLELLVKARVLEFRGEDAYDDAKRARRRRHVEVGEPWNGTTTVSAVVDMFDARFLNAQLDRLAAILAQAGNTESLQVRRSIALGLLASPARALQLLQAAAQGELPEIEDAECPAQGQRGHVCGQITLDPDHLLPKAEIVVHLTDETVGSKNGLARVEGVGPILAGWMRDLLDHHRVTVRPVLNPQMLMPSDAYECPPRMREWVQYRNPHEAFPYSHRSSRGLDMDHTRRFIPGHEGQTRPDNLGPLSRKAHRAKTHAGWRVEQLEPGIFAWTSPLGFQYLVTPSGTQTMHTLAA